MTLILAHTNLITKLAFELEVSVFLDALLKLHALKHTVIFVLVELDFEKLSDRLGGLGPKFLAHCNKLVTVVLMKQHVKSIKQ
jgi:hypothetical protein